MTPEEKQELITTSETTQGSGSSSTKNDFAALKDKTDKTESLVHYGFVIVLIMVATIIVSLELWFITGTISNGQQIYNFQLSNNSSFNAQQMEFNDLKSCLQDGWKNNCFK